ncbi:MAG: hypothetical protein ACON4H_12780 [Rubripirellula sp.]
MLTPTEVNTPTPLAGITARQSQSDARIYALSMPRQAFVKRA